jgi:hypothetical protein
VSLHVVLNQPRPCTPQLAPHPTSRCQKHKLEEDEQIDQNIVDSLINLSAFVYTTYHFISMDINVLGMLRLATKRIAKIAHTKLYSVHITIPIAHTSSDLNTKQGFRSRMSGGETIVKSGAAQPIIHTDGFSKALQYHPLQQPVDEVKPPSQLRLGYLVHPASQTRSSSPEPIKLSASQ